MAKPRVYLDYAATAPVDKTVAKTMQPFLGVTFGNPSSQHSFGREAKKALEGARAILARALNAAPDEIIFTASDTESNNLALKGVALANQKRGNHIILSAVEHDATVEIAQWLQKQGFKIDYVAVDATGKVNPSDIEKIITEKTILVSVVFASNEIGTIQPIKEIGQLCRERGILFHTDASQAFGKLAIDVKRLHVDLLSAGSQKIYGPKGAALLYVRRGVQIEPVIHGGGQEYGLRGGTENVAAIVGFAEAIKLYESLREKETKRLEKLRKILIEGISTIEGSHINGHQAERLPGIISAWFDNVDGELLVSMLDEAGFAVSTGAACGSIHPNTSHILMAIGLLQQQAEGSLRISLGRQTKESEVTDFIKNLAKTINIMRTNES